MAVTTEAIGADQVWSGAFAGLRGYTGRGIGVAVIDSGIAQHRALRGRIVASVDFTGGGRRPASATSTATARTSRGSSPARRSGYAGVAPGAHLVSLQGAGRGRRRATPATSSRRSTGRWSNRARYNIRVINLSLGHPVFESYRDDPLCQAVQRAVNAGIVVVAAAGNFGKTADGRGGGRRHRLAGQQPGGADGRGAATRGARAQRSDDVMATYSSRGPTAIDGLLKPELVAPGNRIVAAAAAGAYLTRTYPERVVSGIGTATRTSR